MKRTTDSADQSLEPGGENAMEPVNQTMTGLVVSLGVLLVVAGAWALLQELLPVALQ